MKILQFVHGYPPELIGGTELYTQALGQRLIARGHTCIVVAGSNWDCPEASIAVGEDRGVVIARLIGLQRRMGFRPSAYDPIAEGLVRKLLDFWRPDVVHLQHWRRLTDNLVAICREFEIPAVVTLHDQWIACSRHHRLRLDEVFCADRTPPCVSCVDRDPWQRIGEIEQELEFRQHTLKRELQLADRLLVPSQAQRIFLQQIVPLPLDRLEVVPLGSPVPGPWRTDHGEPGFPHEPLKVGYWGYLSPEKGVHLLLEAARLVPITHKVEWHIYGPLGEPVYQGRLNRIAEGLPVIFHGEYNYRDLRSAGLDLAVFPSLCWETYSFVLDEALQIGLPVIVPNRGAFCERVGDAGLLFEYGDGRDLANKIESLLVNPSALTRLKRAATAAGVTSMDDHANQLEKIYQEVVDCHRPIPLPDRDPQNLLLHQHWQVIERDREIDLLRQRLVERDRKILDLEARLGDMRTLEARLLEAGRAVDQKEMLLQQSSRDIQERLAVQERNSAALAQQLAALDETRQALARDLETTIDELLRRIDEFERTPAARLQALLGLGRKRRRRDEP
jgi:glycosyltransferase involved in cell wall biosynthesis